MSLPVIAQLTTPNSSAQPVAILGSCQWSSIQTLMFSLKKTGRQCSMYLFRLKKYNSSFESEYNYIFSIYGGSISFFFLLIRSLLEPWTSTTTGVQ